MVTRLRTYEHALRHAFSAGGALQAAVAAAQADANLAVVAGHQVFTAVSRANGEVAGAIACTADAHRLIEALGRKLGFDVSAYGVEQKPPMPGITEGSDTVLRSAA